jgi:hypothetical protein
MSIVQPFVHCIGPVFANDLTTSGAPTLGKNQVWSFRTDFLAPWSWAYTFAQNNASEFKQITVKRTRMQLTQNFMFILLSEGVLVLPYWGLNPRETPDLNHTSWIIPIQGLKSISDLSPSGGLYAAQGNDLLWIPVIEPLAMKLPQSAGQIVALTMDASSFINERMAAATAARPYSMVPRSTPVYVPAPYPSATQSILSYQPTLSPSPLPLPEPPEIPYGYMASGNYRREIVQTFNASIQYVYLSQDSSTLYVLTSESGGSLYTVFTSGPKKLKGPDPILVSSSTSLLTHPRTLDIYTVSNDTVLIYSNSGTLKGTLKTSFTTVMSLAIDNDGKKLYIGGQEKGKGILDVLDLGTARLSNSPPGVHPSLKISLLAILITIILFL